MLFIDMIENTTHTVRQQITPKLNYASVSQPGLSKV